MKSPYDVIKKPVLTEKSYDHLPGKTYTFEVDRRANKVEIRKAVEEVFGVKVARVNTMNAEGKLRRQGAHIGRVASKKKAYVTLQKDSKGIEFFDSIIQ